MKTIRKNATSQHAVIVGGIRTPITNPATGRAILSFKSDAERVNAAAKDGKLSLVKNLNQHIALYQIGDGAVFKSIKL